MVSAFARSQVWDACWPLQHSARARHDAIVAGNGANTRRVSHGVVPGRQSEVYDCHKSLQSAWIEVATAPVGAYLRGRNRFHLYLASVKHGSHRWRVELRLVIHRQAIFARCSARRSRVCFPPSMALYCLTTLSRAAADGKTIRRVSLVLAPWASKAHVA